MNPHIAAAKERGRSDYITLSGKAADAIEKLKAITTSKTDEAVFRDALRLYWALAHAHDTGTTIFGRKDGKEHEIPLFVAEHRDGQFN